MKGADGEFLEALYLWLREFRGDDQARAFFEILRFVIVKFAMRNDFAGRRGAGLFVAENGKFDFAAVDGAFDHQLLREFGGEIKRLQKLGAIVRFRHADGAAQRGGLDENRIAEFLFDFAAHGERFAFPSAARDREKIGNGQFGLEEEALLHVLVHPDGRADYARSDVGQIGKFEQALHGAVFAVGAVEDGEDDVNADGAGLIFIERNESADVRVGGENDWLAFAQDVGKKFLRGGAGEPAAILSDADGHDFVARGIKRGDYRGRGVQGDFVFAGTAAEEDGDAQSFLFCRHCVPCSVSRVLNRCATEFFCPGRRGSARRPKAPFYYARR